MRPHRHHHHDTSPLAEPSEVAAWLGAALPTEWTVAGAPEIDVDRDEIVITLVLTEPASDAGEPDATRAAAIDGRVAGFRTDTKDRRIALAREAEHRFGRSVAWAVRIGATHVAFSNLAVPVMTRLRQPERKVLDTLVAAGVARSRSDALAWSVRMVGRNTEQWLSDLREAMAGVDRLRSEGPPAA